jgi:ribose transport system substrate-binding protein
MREASHKAMTEFLRGCRPGENTLVAAATDSSALGVLDAVREAGQEENFAIVGQDCIPEVLEEMKRGTSAMVGSISHEPETYGPRLIQLGIAILRGYTVPPYNYVHHKAVTPETLGAEEKAKDAKHDAAQAVAVGESA